MITLKQFYSEAAAVHGLAIGPARQLGQRVGRGHSAFKPRSRGGNDASPVLTAVAATRFILGRLAGGFQKDAGERVEGLWFAPVEGTNSEAEIVGEFYSPRVAFHGMPRCRLTGAHTFGDALLAILSDPALAARVDGIQVRAGADEACIFAKYRRPKDRYTRFVTAETRAAVVAADRGGQVQGFATLAGAGLVHIAHMIQRAA